jgi:serine/arginine repetitive matrix protein 2
MWSRFTGSSSASNSNKDEEGRRRRTSDSTRSKRDRDADARSVVSSTSTRKPSSSRRDTAPSSIASFATAFDEMPRSRANTNNSSDLYDDPEDRHDRRRDDRPSSYAESSMSTVRDEKDRKKSKDKDRKSERRRSTRSERSGSLSQAGGYRGDIVDSPKSAQRSFSGQIGSDGFSQFPGQAGAPMMSGALPVGSGSHGPPRPKDMSSHVQSQFPGQDPAQYASSALPGGHPFGAAADYYYDEGQSVHQQPGVRPQPPAVIVGQDTPHLMSAAAQPNPVADTGSGAAADFYGPSVNTSSKPQRPSSSSMPGAFVNTPSSKPARPSSSSMPGAFIDDTTVPQKPPRPSSSSIPGKPSKFGAAATMAGGAALGYAMGHSSSNQEHTTSYSSSNIHHSTAYTSNTPAASASTYNMYTSGDKPSNTTNGSSYLPPYAGAAYGAEGAPPPKPPRPTKPEEQSSGSNAGLYAAGAAGLAAYGLHHHDSHSHSHPHAASHNHSSTSGAFPGHLHNGAGPSSNPYMSGGMAQQHQHTSPVSKFVDWWKDYEDVQKMEEYTEYIGVCKGCFDPRSSVLDAPRQHHYHKRRSSEYLRPSGGIEKQSRYSLKEKKSHSSFSSGDERRKKNRNSGSSWLAAGLGGIGLAKAGKAVFSAGRDDFDDTYSIKSGRTRLSRRSRSRSHDRKSYSYGRSPIRSQSRDRMSQMSVGVTNDRKDRKDHKVVRRHSRSSSCSSSNSGKGKSGLIGTAIGVGLAGAALGAATRRKHSRSRSPKRVHVQHQRRDSSDDERRKRRSQELRRKASRSSTSGASVIEIGGNHEPQSGFFGGFFSAPPPKEKRMKTASLKKQKKKGFFNFGNASTSSSDSEMAFGTGFVKKRRRSSPKRRNSDERLKASLIGLGATAAAITAAKAGKGKRHSEVVAVKEHREGRKGSDRLRPGSRYGDDEWEDLPDDDTSDSSANAGLVYGEHDLKKTKSHDSIASNDSGTSKWGWRWGFGKKKRRSSDNLYDNIASTSFIGPAAAGAAGALTGAAIASGHGRHDSESSSAQTLQSVYPVAPNHPNALFDARRTSSTATSQPMVTSGPGTISIQQPQPMHQVPGAIYSTQPSSQAGYTAPAGPPVFSQAPNQPPYPTQFQTQNVIVQAQQHPSFRRANSSPIQNSSWKRDAAIAGLAATAGAAAVSALKHPDRPPSASSNVRFNLTEEQADKEMRERRKNQDRRDDEDSRRREQQRKDDEARREEEERARRELLRKYEEDRIRREQQLRDEEESRRRDQQRREDEARRDEEDRARREEQRREDETRQIEEDRRQTLLRLEDNIRQEDERRRHELQRQQEEARKFMEIERLAKIEIERRREQQELQSREARGAEDGERQGRMALMESQRRLALEAAEAERKRRGRRETLQRETERIDAERREAEIQDDLERRRREREAQEYSDRYESDRARKLEQQPTGSSIASTATVVQRKEQELRDRERELSRPDTKKSSVAGAVAAGAAAAIATAAISSYKDKEKERERERKRSRERDREHDRGRDRKRESSAAVKTIEPSRVKTYEPSKIEQDYVDEDIFDPNIFKTDTSRQDARNVLQDWEDRYSAKPVSQAEFFAPKELLQNDNLPKVHAIDPNEGAPDLHTYQAHDDYQPMVPPYPPSYSFTATRDGRPFQQQPPPVPSLNLILPTPPGSRAPSVRSASVPPSPAMDPIKESTVEPRPDDLNRARSRVSWGENQFHHFDVPTPDSYREQFVSDGDLKKQEPKYSPDISVEQDSPKSGQQTSTYRPYRPQTSEAPEPKEIAPSTQYVHNEDDSSWDSVTGAASKKSSKKERKSKAAAAAAALTTAAVLSREEQDEWDYKHDNRSVVSNPFSDANMAPSTIAPSVISAVPSSSSVQTAYYQPPSVVSAAPSSSSVQTAYYQPESDRRSDVTAIGPGFVEGEVATHPAPMHIPGSFDDVPGDETPTEDTSSSSTKKDKKGKKKSKSTKENVVVQDVPRRAQPELTGASQPTEVEPEVKPSKKDKKKKSKASKRASGASVDTWEMSDASPPSSPIMERDIRDIEPPRSVEPFRSVEPARTVETSRRVEPAQHHSPSSGASQHEESSGSKAATAAMAGGFAALVGAAMNQDQDRMASDLERARRNLESAENHLARDSPSSPPNGTRALEDSTKNVTIPSYAFEGVDELADRTPKPKKEKRHSSGKWSPTIGSPLRTETKYEDYMGSQAHPGMTNLSSFVEAPQVPTSSPFTTAAPEPIISRTVTDSGYYAPDDPPRKAVAERDSDEFHSAGSDEEQRAETKIPEPNTHDDYDSRTRSNYDEAHDARSRGKYDDDDMSLIGSLSSKYDDPDREERRRRRREARSETREKSRDRGYDLGEGGEQRRRHRRHEPDDGADDWDTRSAVSEARSDANGERRRKHRRHGSEKDGSPESKTRSRSSAASELGDYDEHKSSRRRSKRDLDDDNASAVSSIAGWDEDRSSKKEKEKEKEKRPSGILGLFSSKSRENLAEASSKSSKSKDDDDEERKHRRRKHRSDRGSTIGSDDDDARSTISSSSRREKRSSRSEKGDGERRDTYDDKVHRSSYVR